MLYDVYEFGRSWLESASAVADLGARWLLAPANPLSLTAPGDAAAAALALFSHAATTPGKPVFGINEVQAGDAVFPVAANVVDQRPFGRLLHFARTGAPATDPRLLVVAPMSGHYATILRDTVRRLLPAHDVYVTDWTNANMVPAAAGPFTLATNIAYLLDWARRLMADGTPLHILSVCQSVVPAYAATALLGAGGEATPRSLTMMGGPIDTRHSRTRIDTFALSHPFQWFEQNLIFPVPGSYPGRGRRVYPGFLQLGSFLSMLLGSPINTGLDLLGDLFNPPKETEDAADSAKASLGTLYNEYRAVADLPAEFYLDTLGTVFREHRLPKGEMRFEDTPVDPAAIDGTDLLVVEGADDEMSGRGQTRAALTLATSLPTRRKQYHLAQGAGHYGLFRGQRWERQIAPVVEGFIRRAEHRA